MAQVLQPGQIPLAALAGWVNRHQHAVIDYLREENRVLKEQLGGRRLRLTDHTSSGSDRYEEPFLNTPPIITGRETIRVWATA